MARFLVTPHGKCVERGFGSFELFHFNVFVA